MQLVIIALLLSLGVPLWLIGQYFQYTGVAAIGATLVLIAGGGIVLTGIEVQSGMTVTNTYATVNNSTVVNSSTKAYTYETRSVGEIFGVGILGSMGIGGLLMILAAVLFGQSLTE